jgi:hypothetical protein
MQIDKLNTPNKFPIYLFTLAVLGSHIIWLEMMLFSTSLILGREHSKPRICIVFSRTAGKNRNSPGNFDEQILEYVNLYAFFPGSPSVKDVQLV